MFDREAFRILLLTSMNHYLFHRTLSDLWKTGLARYQSGKNRPKGFLADVELSLLSSLGLTLMDVFDAVEDFASRGEPDFETFLLVSAVRKDYFFLIQGGQWSPETIKMEELPSKDAEYAGIAWLPRIIPKAEAKLKGELPPELMYGCGGDRKFFKEQNVHPAEFLRLTWFYDFDRDKIAEWLHLRSQTVQTSGSN